MSAINVLRNKSNTLLVNYNNKGLLLDTGYDIEDTEKIVEYLKSNNIELEIVIVSHFHKDHIQGVGLIKKMFPNVNFYSSKITKFFYENNWAEKYLYSNLISMDSCCDVEFKIIGDNYYFYDTNIEILKSNGHCYGNLIFKIDDCLFCPDIIIYNSDYLPFISDVSSYYNEIDILRKIKEVNTIISSHAADIISLNLFHKVLNNTEKIINKYIKDILELIDNKCNLYDLFEKLIKLNYRTRCFTPDMTKSQYGYTIYVIRNILNFLEEKGKIRLIYDNAKVTIERIIND